MSGRKIPAPTTHPLDREQLEYLWNLHVGPEAKGTADPGGLIQRLIVDLDQALMKLNAINEVVKRELQ